MFLKNLILNKNRKSSVRELKIPKMNEYISDIEHITIYICEYEIKIPLRYSCILSMSKYSQKDKIAVKIIFLKIS